MSARHLWLFVGALSVGSAAWGQSAPGFFRDPIETKEQAADARRAAGARAAEIETAYAAETERCKAEVFVTRCRETARGKRELNLQEVRAVEQRARTVERELSRRERDRARIERDARRGAEEEAAQRKRSEARAAYESKQRSAPATGSTGADRKTAPPRTEKPARSGSTLTAEERAANVRRFQEKQRTAKEYAERKAAERAASEKRRAERKEQREAGQQKEREMQAPAAR